MLLKLNTNFLNYVFNIFIYAIFKWYIYTCVISQNLKSKTNFYMLSKISICFER